MITKMLKVFSLQLCKPVLFFILAINLVLVIGISFLACFVIHLKGVKFAAFEESSPYYLFYPVINLKIFF